MPIYDYVCQICGHRMEVMHGVHDAGPPACERCAGPLRKAVTTPAIVFKGSGWAKKDARAAARSSDKPAAADKPGDGGPSAASAAAESKPTAGSGATGND